MWIGSADTNFFDAIFDCLPRALDVLDYSLLIRVEALAVPYQLELGKIDRDVYVWCQIVSFDRMWFYALTLSYWNYFPFRFW